MKKHLKLIFLFVAVMALFAMTMLVGSAAFDETQQVGTAYYYTVAYHDAGTGMQVRGYATTLAEAVANAEEGDTVTVLANVSESTAVTVDKSLTINGDGNTITATSTLTSSQFFLTVSGGEVKLLDIKLIAEACKPISVKGGAKFDLGAEGADNSRIYIEMGAVTGFVTEGNNTVTTIWGGTIQSTTTTNTATVRVGTASSTEKPHLQINGGNIYALSTNKKGYCVYANGASTLNITDGYFAYTKKKLDPTATGGVTDGNNAAVYIITGSLVQIEGGTFWNGQSSAAIILSDAATHNVHIGGTTSVYGHRCVYVQDGKSSSAYTNLYIYGGTFSPNPGQANSKLLDVDGCYVNVYVFDGTFDTSATAAGNAGTNGGAIHMAASSGNTTTKLYIYGGTFINNSTTVNSAVLNYNESASSSKYTNEGAGVVYIGTGSKTLTVNGESVTYTGTGATFIATKGCKLFRFPNVKANADPGRKCSLTIEAGTFTVEGSQLSSLNESATISITGGTFNITGGNMFSMSRLNEDLNLPTVSITGGIFNIAGGALLTAGQLVEDEYVNATVGEVTVNLGAGATLPDDIELWKDATFNISGGATVTVSEGKTFNIASVEEAIALAVAESGKTMFPAYENGTYVCIGKNMHITISELPTFTVNGGTLNITGGVYELAAKLITVSAGTVNISGGTFDASATLLSMTAGTVNITGGSFTRVGAGNLVSISGGEVSISGESTTIVGRDFGANYGLLWITGGSLTIDEASFTLTNGGSVVSFNGKETVTVNGGTFLKENSGANYYSGAVFYFNDSCTQPTLTVNGGTFTAPNFVRIYAPSTTGEVATKVTVTGGTFIDNAKSNIGTDHRYLFQVARKGKHVIEMTGDVLVQATNYTFIFNCNASADGATFNIHGGTYEGGRAWMATNMENTTFSVKNATFRDVTGAMSGASSTTKSVIYYTIDKAGAMTIENSTFELKTPDLTLFKWDGQASLAVKESTFVVPALIRDEDTYSQGTSFTDSIIVITDTDNIVFPCTSTKLERTVVLAPKGTSVFRDEILTAYAPDVRYGGVTYKSWTKSAATAENAPVLEEGAQLYLSTEKNGIRFSTTVSADAMAALRANAAYAGASFKYYTLIAPADYVAVAGAFTKAALDQLGIAVPYVSILAKNTLVDSVTEGVSFSGALVGLKSNTRAYAAVAYIEVVNAEGEVIDIIYSAYNSFDNARTAEQIADDIIFDEDEYLMMNSTDKGIVDAYANGVASLFEGKRVLVVGNSLTYYGGAVLHKSQSYLSQASREGDHGFFFQLGLSNDIVFSVTNWTFGGHTIGDIFLGNCVADRGCDGEDHLAYLTDRDYDYVVLQQGQAGREVDMSEVVKYVKAAFEPTNPNVQIVVLGTTSNYRTDYTSNALIVPYFAKAERESGIIVADWGRLATDLMNGVVQVENSQFEYNKNSFIVNWSGGSDGYHPNMLSGYLTAVFMYCVITGESAYGQDYEFALNTRVNGGLNVDEFIAKFYTYDNPDTEADERVTNFADILACESEIRGIQKLIDQYIAEKAYRNDAIAE